MVNYRLFSKNYIDGLPLEIDTHRHFQTSKKTVNRCASFCKKIVFPFILDLIYIYIYIYVLIYTIYIILFYLCIYIYVKKK